MGLVINANIYAPAALVVQGYEYFNHDTIPPTDEYITEMVTDGSGSSSSRLDVQVGRIDSEGNPIYEHVYAWAKQVPMSAGEYQQLTSVSGVNVQISLVPSSHVSLLTDTSASPGFMSDGSGLIKLPVYCNTNATVPFELIYAQILYDWYLWYFDDSFEYLQLMRMNCVDEFDFDWGGIEETPNTTIWKLDDNNDGYPWIWGWTEDPKEKGGLVYIKKENGFETVNEFIKSENEYIGITCYIKTENGFVRYS